MTHRVQRVQATTAAKSRPKAVRLVVNGEIARIFLCPRKLLEPLGQLSEPALRRSSSTCGTSPPPRTAFAMSLASYARWRHEAWQSAVAAQVDYRAAGGAGRITHR